jgi:AcrR family transcriptional regulator
MISQEKRIIQVATKLFLENGVKSVTIDRIVKELHTSKRTVYNHFSDKTALLKACLAVYHAKVKQENDSIIAQADNAIAAMGHLLQHIIRRANVVNPNFFNDILHYYPGLLNESYRNTGNFAHQNLEDLAQWGIDDGLFNKYLDVEVASKTLLSLLKLLKDTSQFPLGEFSKERLTFGILIPYLRGLCSEKGLEILALEEELFRVTL